MDDDDEKFHRGPRDGATHSFQIVQCASARKPSAARSRVSNGAYGGPLSAASTSGSASSGRVGSAAVGGGRSPPPRPARSANAATSASGGTSRSAGELAYLERRNAARAHGQTTERGNAPPIAGGPPSMRHTRRAHHSPLAHAVADRRERLARLQHDDGEARTRRRERPARASRAGAARQGVLQNGGAAAAVAA